MKLDVDAAFKQYGKQLVGIMFHQTRNIQDASEIVQETFVRYAQNFDQLPDDVTTLNWLIRVSYNLSIDNFRKVKRYIKYLANFDSVEKHISDNDRIELSQEIEEMLLKVNSKERMVVLLKFYQDLTSEEIARSLQIPQGSVKSMLSRALEKMKNKRG